MNMINDLKEILIKEETITKRVRKLGEQISKDYEGENRKLLVVGILKGSVIFASELIKNITIPCQIDFMALSSYGSSSETSGVVRILKDLDYNVEGSDIIIIEDIIDSGVTLDYLLKYFKARNVNSIEIATLLTKPARRKVDINVKYLGFEVPDEFIVGYGLDYAEKYRNLPFIGVLKEEIYEK